MSERGKYDEVTIKVSRYKTPAIGVMNCGEHEINILDHKIKHKPTFFSNPTNVKHYFQASNAEN